MTCAALRGSWSNISRVGVWDPRSRAVGVIVHATDIGDLQPVPIVLARERQLRFGAEGEASGAFEITLFLIDGSKREGEPAMLDRICATPAP